MNITVKLTDLKRIVNLVSIVAPTRTTLPTLDAVLLAYNDCELLACATNLRSYARARCEAVGEQSGSFAVRAALLSVFLNGCTAENVEIEVGQRATITCGTNRAMLSVVPLDDFKPHPTVEGPCVVIAAKELSEALARMTFAAADEKDGNPERVSVALDFGPKLDVIALNGKQLAVSRLDVEGQGVHLVPMFLAAEFRKALEGVEGEVTLTINENAVQLATEAWSLSGPKLNLNYPDWRNRLPWLFTSEGKSLLKFKRAELLSAFRNCIPFGEMRFARVFAHGDGTKAVIEITGQDATSSTLDYQGPPFEFFMDGTRMVEVLNSLHGDEVTLEFKDERAVGVVIREDNFTAAIMLLEK